MSNQGWIRIHRSITDHWIWGYEKFTKAQAWIDLLVNANHSENKIMIKGELIKVDRGQQIRSQTTLSKAWKWDRKTVSKFLKMLEKDGMITVNSTHLTTCITICNYNDFQNNSQNNGQRNTQHDTHAIPSATDTNKNDKKEKNDNNKDIDFSKWPYLPDENIFQEWLDMRKRLKAPVTQVVANTFGKQLHLAVKRGFSVNDCISDCITGNWKGFKSEWMKDETNRSNNTKSKAEKFSDELDRIAAEDIRKNGFTNSLDN